MKARIQLLKWLAKHGRLRTHTHTQHLYLEYNRDAWTTPGRRTRTATWLRSSWRSRRRRRASRDLARRRGSGRLRRRGRRSTPSAGAEEPPAPETRRPRRVTPCATTTTTKCGGGGKGRGGEEKSSGRRDKLRPYLGRSKFGAGGGLKTLQIWGILCPLCFPPADGFLNVFCEGPHVSVCCRGHVRCAW